MTPQYIQFDKNEKRIYKDREMAILHREDGPAVEWTNDGKEWWLNGVQYPEEEFKKRTAEEFVLTMDEIAAKFRVDVSKLKITK